MDALHADEEIRRRLQPIMVIPAVSEFVALKDERARAYVPLVECSREIWEISSIGEVAMPKASDDQRLWTSFVAYGVDDRGRTWCKTAMHEINIKWNENGPGLSTREDLTDEMRTAAQMDLGARTRVAWDNWAEVASKATEAHVKAMKALQEIDRRFSLAELFKAFGP